MHKLLLGGAIAAGLSCAGVAQAADYTFDMTFGEPSWVQGIGPDNSWGRGGTVTYSGPVMLGDQTFNVSGTCVMMNQPPNSLFRVHMTCDGADENGGSASVIYGCNPLNDAMSEYSCVGGIQGTGGEIDGWRGAETLRIVIVEGVGATGHGTGQWFN